MAKLTGFIAALGALAMLPCASQGDAPRQPAQHTNVQSGDEAPPAIQTPVEVVSDPIEVDPDPLLTRAPDTVLSPIDAAQLRALREIAERSDSLRDNVFAKMGGSSIASRAFLHCFTSRQIDLGAHDHLQDTIDFFRQGNAGGGNPFTRESLAARVGWSLRQGLTGRPPRVVQEVRATKARFALAFFGGNDVQGRNPITFGERLEKMLSFLVDRGVVPVVGSTTPRGDDPTMDQWARRYNLVSRGIARAWKLPYVDFYSAAAELPNRGLAGDGVHPNVHREGRRTRPCWLNDEAVRSGFNARNLHTLELLHRLRTTLFDHEDTSDESNTPAPAQPEIEEPLPLVGAGTREQPLRLATIPFGERISDPSAFEPSPEASAECDSARSANPTRVYRIRVEEVITIEALALTMGGARAVIHVFGDDPTLPCSLDSEDGSLRTTLAPGIHHIGIELIAPNRQSWRSGPKATVVIDRAIER